MTKFEITAKAAPVAGGALCTHEYEAETAEEAVASFWADVDAFGLYVAEVVRVVQA